MSEPDNLVLEILRNIRQEMAEMRTELKSDISGLRSELKADIADVRSELKSDIADVKSDLLKTRKELSEQIVGLRRAVVDYHSSVIGRGIVISELDARLRRVENHLHLSDS